MTPRLSFDPSSGLQNRPTFTLPPLILHPFADSTGPGKLVESSRASLKLQGLLPAGESSREDLDKALLDGRYSELRMLFYVGKDLARWIDQCLEFAERNREQLPAGTSYQSFAAMLVKDAPANVQSKLRKWGVADYKSIFSARARPAYHVRGGAGPRSAVGRIRAQLFPLRRPDLRRQTGRMRFHAGHFGATATSTCTLPANIRECWNEAGTKARTSAGLSSPRRLLAGL